MEELSGGLLSEALTARDIVQLVTRVYDGQQWYDDHGEGLLPWEERWYRLRLPVPGVAVSDRYPRRETLATADNELRRLRRAVLLRRPSLLSRLWQWLRWRRRVEVNP